MGELFDFFSRIKNKQKKRWSGKLFTFCILLFIVSSLYIRRLFAQYGSHSPGTVGRNQNIVGCLSSTQLAGHRSPAKHFRFWVNKYSKEKK
jgi:hypothetical protein